MNRKSRFPAIFFYLAIFKLFAFKNDNIIIVYITIDLDLLSQLFTHALNLFIDYFISYSIIVSFIAMTFVKSIQLKLRRDSHFKYKDIIFFLIDIKINLTLFIRVDWLADNFHFMGMDIIVQVFFKQLIYI